MDSTVKTDEQIVSVKSNGKFTNLNKFEGKKANLIEAKDEIE